MLYPFIQVMRRGVIVASLIATPLIYNATAQSDAVKPTAVPEGPHVSIADFGAIGDGQTLNTVKIQAGIDQLAAKGGGTLVIPQGVFVSGALFVKPGVNVSLQKDAVLKCSTDMKSFPAQRTRIEGHFEDHFNPALINAKGLRRPAYYR